jgi:hypothetical protein
VSACHQAHDEQEVAARKAAVPAGDAPPPGSEAAEAIGLEPERPAAR